MGSYQLICEGACNPNIGAVDDLGRRYLTEKSRGGGDCETYFHMHRRLTYTSHTMTANGMFATCDECGTLRGYGARSKAVR